MTTSNPIRFIVGHLYTYQGRDALINMKLVAYDDIYGKAGEIIGHRAIFELLNHDLGHIVPKSGYSNKLTIDLSNQLLESVNMIVPNLEENLLNTIKYRKANK